MCYKGVRVKDLTAHSIGKHILQTALPIAAGMLFPALYFRLMHQPQFCLAALEAG
jgi:hypothetical protein